MRDCDCDSALSKTRTAERFATRVLITLCALVGCSDRRYETVPVSGRVTLDGEPLADVGLLFVPLARKTDEPNVGPGSLGRTDATGRYHLQTARGETGAVPTEHVVRLSLAEEPRAAVASNDFTPEGDIRRRDGRRKRTLPACAGDGTLRFNVPPDGTDQADFDLVSDSCSVNVKN
jgi:hypothetical protein